MSGCEKTKRPRPGARFLFLFLLLWALAASPLRAFPAGQQTYFVLGFEEQIIDMLFAIDDGEGTPIVSQTGTASSYIGITVPAAGQVIVYDHGEDGYEADLYNPTQSTTLIFGDGDTTNGIPHDDPGGDDLLVANQVIALESSDATPGGITASCTVLTDLCDSIDLNPSRDFTEFRYGGEDIIFTAGQPINVVHVVFPAGTGNDTVIGGTWEIFPVEAYDENLTYTIPVGVDSYADNGQDTGEFENFKYAFVIVQATEDDTPVVVDNGTTTASFVLQKGQSWSSQGTFSPTASLAASAGPAMTINQNTTVTGGKPIQVGLISGGDGRLQARFFNIIPTGLYASEYVSPVHSHTTGTDDYFADVIVNNPNASQITVAYQDSAGSGTFTVPGDSARAFSEAVSRYVPDESSLRLSSDSLFWGIGIYDTGGTSDGTGGDWGFALQPNGFLQESVSVPHGPGHRGLVSAQGGNGNGSPIWVAPIDDLTTFTVDWNGGGPDSIDLDNDGAGDVTSITLGAQEAATFYDPNDDDQTGAVITADGRFVSAWGYNRTEQSNEPDGNGTARAQENLDWGYTINPFDFRFQEPLLTVDKTVLPSSVFSGELTTVTICASSEVLGPVDNSDIIDVLPAGWSYVVDSGVIIYPDLTEVSLEPADPTSTTLVWNFSESLNTREQVCVRFQAQSPTVCSPTSSTVTDDFSPAGFASGTGWTGNWQEVGEANGAFAGDVQGDGTNNNGCGGNVLSILGGADILIGAYRQLDLTSYCAPELQFDYDADGLLGGDEIFRVWASTDGTNWTELNNYPSANGACDTENLDLSMCAGSVCYVRFTLEGDTEGSGGFVDDIAIDNIVVSDTASCTPTLGSVTDNFTGQYTGGSGWTGNWTEMVENDGADAGDVQANTNQVQGCTGTGNVLHIEGGADVLIGAYRRLDLTGFCQPELRYIRDIDQFFGGDEFARVWASTDAVTWTQLGAAYGTDSGGCAADTRDLSGVCADSDCYIRFTIEGDNENNDIAVFDSIEVVDAGAVAGRSFVENLGLATGEYNGLPFQGSDTARIYLNVLRLTLSVDKAFTKFGETLRYTLLVENTGGTTLNGIQLRQPVPAFTTFDSATGGGALDTNSNTVVWSGINLSPSGSTTVTFDVDVNQVPFDQTPVFGRAAAVLSGTRIVDSNEVETLVRTPIFLLIKDAPGGVSPNGDITYGFTLYNNGDVEATGVTLTDRIPREATSPQTDYVRGSAAMSRGTVSFDQNSLGTFAYSPLAPPGIDPQVSHILFDIGTMPATSVTTGTFTVRATTGVADETIRNVAFLDNDQTTIRVTNIVETVISNLQLTLAADKTLAEPRDDILYTLSARNLSTTTGFTDPEVNFPIPAETEYILGTATAPATWTVEWIDQSGNVLSIEPSDPTTVASVRFRPNAGSLPVSSSTELTVTVNVPEFVPAGTVIDAQGEIDSDETVAIPSNIVVVPTLNVRLVLSRDVGVQLPDGRVVWTVTVQNIGAVPITGATLEGPSPGFDFLDLSSYDPLFAATPTPTSTSASSVSWSIGTTLVPLAAPLTFSFASTINSTAVTGDTLDALVRLPHDDGVAFSNAAQVIVGGLDFVAGSSASTFGTTSQVLYFPARVTNTSSTTTETFVDFTFTNDTFPGANTRIFRDLDGDGAYDSGLDTLLTDDGGASGPVDISNLGPGQTIYLLVEVTVPGTVTGGEVNNTVLTATGAFSGTVASWTDTVTVISATAVTLVAARATAEPGGVRVSWRTVREHLNRGFWVQRSTSRGGPWQAVGGLVAGAIQSTTPRDYQLFDPGAPSNGPLYYRLADVEVGGAVRWHPAFGVDRDGDGVPFDLEERWGLSDSHAGDTSGDPDGDGMVTADEILQGRDPFAAEALYQAPVELVTATPPPVGVRVVEAGEGYRVLELTLHDFELEAHPGDTFSYPELTGVVSGYGEVPGWPRLPQVGVFLPEGFTQVADEGADVSVRTGVAVGPTPTSELVDEAGAVGTRPVYTPDPSFYSGAFGPYPGTPWRLHQPVGSPRPVLLFQPFTYDHTTRTLAFRSRIRVRVSRALAGGSSVAGLTVAADPGLTAVPAGPAYRLRTATPGPYRVTRAELLAASADPTGFDPRNFALFQGGTPVPIRVLGEGDGSFDPADAIEFYAGDAGDRHAAGDGYFLLYGNTPGLRWSQAASGAATAGVAASYRHVDRQEFRDYYFGPIPGAPEEEHFVAGAAQWAYSGAAPLQLPVTISDPAPVGAGALIRLDVGASGEDLFGDPDHHHRVLFDGTAVGQEVWSGRGFHRAAAAVPHEFLTAGVHQVGLEVRTDQVSPNVTFDFLVPRDLEVEYDRLFVAQGDRLAFRAAALPARFQVAGFTTAAITVLDVTVSSAPVEVTGTSVTGAGPYTVEFGADGPGPREYLVFAAGAGQSPTDIRPVARGTLRSAATRAGWVAVVPAGWEAALAPLVALHAAGGLEPLVVSMDEVADEFTGGVAHPEAIRRLLVASRSWARSPRFLLLGGDANANPRAYPGGFFTSDPVYVPAPLRMVGVDLQRSEVTADQWYGRLDGDDAPPVVAVGRLAARSSAELAQMANKLVAYGAAGGTWTREILSVADDGEPFFESNADGALGPVLPGLQIERLYQDDLPGAGAMEAALQAAFQGGALVAQFVGHGSIYQWTADDILKVATVQGLNNGSQLPFVVSLTCEDGYLGDVFSSSRSLAEEMVLNPGGGAVAYLASGARLTAASKDLYHRSLMDALFAGEKRRIGDAMRVAGANYLANSGDAVDLLDAFSLLGDPATKLRVPNPLSPQGLQAGRALDGSVVISWLAVQDPSVVGYDVYRRLGPGAAVLLGRVTGTSFVDATLAVPGALTPTAYYSVRAVTAASLASASTAEVGVAIQGVAVIPPAGSGGGGGGCAAGGAGSGAGWAWLLVLGLSGWRRRRDAHF